MPSPFPGMDPYLEQYWGDVHTSLVTYARNQLTRILPAGLVARVEEFISIEDEREMEIRRRRPDVQVAELPGRSAPASVTLPLVEADEKVLVLPVNWDPETQRDVRIIDQFDGGRLVTIIEVLSPSNKSSGSQEYRRKQEQLLASGVNIVEIDFLREGQWVVLAPEQFVPSHWRSPYKISVFRTNPRPANWYYAATFQERLPQIRIPLRSEDPVTRLDLQALIDQAYADAAYDTIDYTREPVPPLPPADAAWMDAWLRKQGRR